jgi:prepilin-type processing-associated H-X9-DG protein
VLGPYDFYPTASFPYSLPANVDGTSFHRPYAIHNGSVNVIFCDGHARSVEIRALIGPMPKGFPLGDPRNLWSNE